VYLPSPASRQAHYTHTHTHTHTHTNTHMGATCLSSKHTAPRAAICCCCCCCTALASTCAITPCHTPYTIHHTPYTIHARCAAWRQKYIYTYIHIYIYTYTYTHIHIYIHTYIHILGVRRLPAFALRVCARVGGVVVEEKAIRL